MPSQFSGSQRQFRQTGLVLMLFLSSAALLFFSPVIWGAYGRILLFTLLLHVTMALSYDLIGGLLGYLYLGHGVFFGLGAYLTAMALGRNLPLILSLLSAAALVFLVAILLSLPLFRLRGSVFALATLGLLFLGARLSNNLPNITGGAAGFSLPPNPNAKLTYLLSAVLAFAVTLLHWMVSRSRLGLKLRSIRASEDMAESVGIDSGRMKRLAFILSTVPPALAGGLQAREISFVIPAEAFGLENSLAPLLMCLLLREGTTWGPVLGAIILTAAQELIWTTLPHFHLSLYGILLIFIGIQRVRNPHDRNNRAQPA